MNIVIRIIIILGLTYIVLLLLLFLMQKKMVYFPSRRISALPSDINIPFQEIELITPDQIKLHSWLIGAHEGEPCTGDVVLFCHGNAGNISHRLDTVRIFRQLGFLVFIFDYRGYGRSQGTPSEMGTYTDGETAWQYLTQSLNIPPEKIILWGRSLGGAVAAYLATRVQAKALILESTFTSIPDLAAQIYPIFPAHLLCRIHYNTQKRLSTIHMPLLVIHSPQDEIIPFSHGQRLFAAAREPKKFLTISGSHNQGFIDDQVIYIQGLNHFFSSLK